MLLAQMRPAIVSFFLLSIITGIAYPFVVTGIAQTTFHSQAQGSLIMKDGKIIGSFLIGQNFDDPKYFWGRLSATSPAYNASSSTGSNWGPSNPDLVNNIKMRIAALKNSTPQEQIKIPVDLVTASASGLDPHITLAAAYFQIARVARVRGLTIEQVRSIIIENTKGRFWGLLGEPVVNVLQVNIALDDIKN